MSTKEIETFIGPCSKFVSGQGWTTEIPVEQLNAKGYYNIKNIADVGYRKIPENAVVPTREEYINKLIKYYGVSEIKDMVRKETAEKFAEMLKAYIDSNEVQTAFFGCKCFIDKETVDEISKEITEGKR